MTKKCVKIALFKMLKGDDVIMNKSQTELIKQVNYYLLRELWKYVKGYVGTDKDEEWVGFYSTIGIRRNTYTAYVTGDIINQLTDLNKKKSKLENTGISFEVFTGEKLIELSTSIEKNVSLEEWEQFFGDEDTVKKLSNTERKKYNNLRKQVLQRIEDAFACLSIGLPYDTELYRAFYYFKMKIPFNIKDSSGKILEVIGVLEHVKDRDWKYASDDVLISAIEYMKKNIETALIVKQYRDKFNK